MKSFKALLNACQNELLTFGRNGTSLRVDFSLSNWDWYEGSLPDGSDMVHYGASRIVWMGFNRMIPPVERNGKIYIGFKSGQKIIWARQRPVLWDGTA